MTAVSNHSIDQKRALAHLMDLLAIEGLSGREGKVAQAVKKKLTAAGCKASWIGHDSANRKIPGDYEVGNLTVMVDFNNIQIDGVMREVMNVRDVRQKYESFGWHAERERGLRLP